MGLWKLGHKCICKILEATGGRLVDLVVIVWGLAFHLCSDQVKCDVSSGGVLMNLFYYVDNLHINLELQG